MKQILTFKIKHNKDFSQEKGKAAIFAINNKGNFSSKIVNRQRYE